MLRPEPDRPAPPPLRNYEPSKEWYRRRRGGQLSDCRRDRMFH
jgi:hypothetical protein